MKVHAARLKELINAEDILIMPGIYDGFSARLVERAGFAAGFITGSGVSESRLGQPDVGIMGLSENLDACRSLVGCTTLPLLADGDTGYGNAMNVFFAVQKFEATGISGLMLEDQVWPKRCGHMAGKEIISAEEMVYKLNAAIDARSNPDFVIKARTDAVASLGVSEAIRRANLYADAGADLLFADALLSAEDVGLFAKEVNGPVCVNMGFGLSRRATTPLLSPKELNDLGVAAAIYPRMLTSAALRAQQMALGYLKEMMASGQLIEKPDLQASFEELNGLMGLEDITEMDKRYMSAERFADKYRIAR